MKLIKDKKTTQAIRNEMSSALKEVSLLLKIILWAGAALMILRVYLNKGEVFWSFFGIILGLFSASKNAVFAHRIKSNPNVAYAIGFIFGLVGLLGYWIYYKTKSK